MNEKRVAYLWRAGETLRIQGPTEAEMGPKELMLAALAKCEAMTCAALFDKMRLAVEELRVEASGVIEGDPRRGDSLFGSLAVDFRVRCPADQREKARHAIALSRDKYCGVGTMLSRVAPIEYTLSIEH